MSIGGLYMVKLREPTPNLNNQVQGVGNVAKDVKTDYEVPSGYITIELSTNGLVGAPKRFHARNFDTADLLNLALSENEDLPEKVAKMLDNLILEDDVSVLNFHEKEVVEFLVRLYQAFYSTVLKEVDFPWNEEDINHLKKQYGENSTEFQTRYADLKAGREKPKVDIDLAAVRTVDIDPATFRTDIYLTEKATGFSAGFSFPRYGDVVVLRNFILQEFRQRDKEFANLKEILKFRQDAEQRLRQGEDITLGRIPNIPEFEKNKYKEYETEKSIFTVIAIKALHLIMVDGQDVSKLSLKERMELAQDPRLDYKMMKVVDDFYKKMNIGLEGKVAMKNPLKGVVELRDYSFRLVDLLQAIRLYESDEYSIDFEPTHVQ
jgi:hypothetical protein